MEKDESDDEQLRVNGTRLETVKRFECLVSTIFDNALQTRDSVHDSSDSCGTSKTKSDMEKQELEKRIQAWEMRCYRSRT